MGRVIAKSGEAFLVETRTAPTGLRLGVVYDTRDDVVHPEMLIASIAARGGWVEVDPAEYVVLADRLQERLPRGDLPNLPGVSEPPG